MRKKKSTSQKLLAIVIIPMLLLAIVCGAFCYYLTSHSLFAQKEAELSSVAALTALEIDTEYPGDYSLDGDKSIRLFKGDTDITEKYELVDRISELTKLEVSLIYSDTRILTTLPDVTGSGRMRATGLGVASQVVSALKSTNSGLFYKNTKINKTVCFSYYYPLENMDGQRIGAIEVCSPYSTISPLIIKTTLPVVIAILLLMALLVVLVRRYGASNNAAIGKLLAFTKDAASGNDSASLDMSIMKQNDEFGEIAGSVLEMHRSLRDMMDKDALTKLYNRRSASRKLDRIRSHYTTNGATYSVSIGDIDFFKRVNDTYGHDAGDAVLQTVATILQKHMKDHGFVARWGGEEFLLVFDRTELASAVTKLETILKEVRELSLEYEGRIIKVTMSFGVACKPEATQDELVKLADECLYYAKEHGRNRIVSELPEQNN